MGTYIHNLAVTFIKEFCITDADLGSRETDFICRSEKATAMSNKLKRMRPETLGKIIAYGLDPETAAQRGKVSLYEVLYNLGGNTNSFEDDFTPHKSGKEFLVLLARAAIVAEINEIIPAPYYND